MSIGYEQIACAADYAIFAASALYWTGWKQHPHRARSRTPRARRFPGVADQKVVNEDSGSTVVQLVTNHEGSYTVAALLARGLPD